MKISEVRKIIKQKLDYGLISIDESNRFNNRLSKIQASNHSLKDKKVLYSVYA